MCACVCFCLQELVRITHTPFVKSFAFRRLELLESRFQLHVKLNADREVAGEFLDCICA